MEEHIIFNILLRAIFHNQSAEIHGKYLLLFIKLASVCTLFCQSLGLGNRQNNITGIHRTLSSFVRQRIQRGQWAHSEKQARARMDFTSCQLYRSARPKPKPKAKPSRDQGQARMSGAYRAGSL